MHEPFDSLSKRVFAFLTRKINTRVTMPTPRISPTSLSFQQKYSKSSIWLVVVVAFLAGRFSAFFDGASLARFNSSLLVSPSMASAASSGDDGWQSIQVFYGKTRVISNQRWYSQARQDELIMALLRHKQNGYFIDLASNDATYLSNTYAMERYYNWNGLCIEANFKYWYNLTHLRQCQIFGAVMGSPRMSPVEFRYSGNEYGGILGFDNSVQLKQESLLSYTVTLEEVLQRGKAPRSMDYLSLDVEGAEWFVMKNFSFDNYRIQIITGERLNAELRSYLEANRYELLANLTLWGESLWVHRSADIDRSALSQFQLPIRTT